MSKLKIKKIKNISIVDVNGNVAMLSKRDGAISVLEKDCTYLQDMVKEVNVLIKDKLKHFTVGQIIEQGIRGVLKICISARFVAGCIGFDGSILPLMPFDQSGNYRNNVALSKQECEELRHSEKVNVIRDNKLAVITQANLYVLKEDKEAFMLRVAEEYQDQCKFMLGNGDAFPFLNDSLFNVY